MSRSVAEADLYVAVGKAEIEKKVVPEASPVNVDEAGFYAVGAVISAVSLGRDPDEGNPRSYSQVVVWVGWVVWGVTHHALRKGRGVDRYVHLERSVFCKSSAG